MTSLLTLTECGLYSPGGDFFIDPWKPVERAVITHAHADHARWGSGKYLCSRESLPVMQIRLGGGASIQAEPYGKAVTLNGVKVSLHPAGHILGSSQVRVEQNGEVAVVSGDYKTGSNITCTPFEPVRCNTFITESTFGLPVYRWRPQEEVFSRINQWWRANREAGKASVLFAYALGKAQRLLAGVDASVGPIYCHGAVARLNRGYQAGGVRLPEVHTVGSQPRGYDFGGALVIAPPSAGGSAWMRRFGDYRTGYVSGWMQIRGTRRRRAVDRGFVLSDHSDWDGLVQAVVATGAEEVWVTHGYSLPFARWLAEQGLNARAVATEFQGEVEQVEMEEETAALPDDSGGEETA